MTKRQERVDGTTAGGRGGERYPYERDTTAGHTTSEFPSMHAEAPRVKLWPVCCGVCGLQFGFVESQAQLEGLCNIHEGWYERKKATPKRA